MLITRNKSDPELEELIQEADRYELTEKQKAMLLKMKRKNEKKYSSNLTNSFCKVLMLENDEYGGATNHDVLAFKAVDYIMHKSKDFVKDLEVLHRMTGEAKTKVDLEVSGIEEYIKPVLDKEKF